MSPSSSRRDFIKTAVLTPWAAVSCGAASARAAVEPVKRNGVAALKVSLNAYSFAKLLNDHALGASRA